MFLRPADTVVTSNPPDLAVKLSYEVMGGSRCVVVWWEDVCLPEEEDQITTILPSLFYCIWTPLSEMHISLAQQEFVKRILRARGFILKFRVTGTN